MAFRPFRSRLAALVLLFASPGFAGLAVDAAHPCPEQAPWTVDSPASGHHHDGPQSPEQHDCKCVGTCETAVVAAIDSREVITLLAPVEGSRSVPLHFQIIPLGRPGDRLPPATAPPLV